MKKCDICGKEFEPRQSNHKRCSPECTKEGQRRNNKLPKHYQRRLERQKKRYHEDPERKAYIKRKNKEKVERNTKIIREVQKDGCIKCGENDPACLDFHHRNPKQKDQPIARMRHYSEERLKTEIAKCDVLCSNCHRKLHFYSDPTSE